MEAINNFIRKNKVNLSSQQITLLNCISLSVCGRKASLLGGRGSGLITEDWRSTFDLVTAGSSRLWFVLLQITYLPVSSQCNRTFSIAEPAHINNNTFQIHFKPRNWPFLANRLMDVPTDWIRQMDNRRAKCPPETNPVHTSESATDIVSSPRVRTAAALLNPATCCPPGLALSDGRCWTSVPRPEGRSWHPTAYTF